MEINRQGCTRIVILTKRCAFKMPNFLNGWKLFLKGLICNMEETTISKYYKEYFCPVLFHLPGGFLIVMPKVRVLTDGEMNLIPHTIKDHSGVFIHIPSNGAVFTVERKANSFGWLNGKIVAIDYGD